MKGIPFKTEYLPLMQGRYSYHGEGDKSFTGEG